MMPILLPFLRFVGWLFFLVLGPLRIRNQRSIPRRGGVLLVANHQSFADAIALQVACPRHINYMANRELFNVGWLRWFVRWFRVFPVKTGSPDRAALRYAVELLKAGKVVCIFPEGRLSETGELLPFLPGATLIAKMADVPVLPAGIRNTRNVVPYMEIRFVPTFKSVWVNWGSPRVVPKAEEPEETLAWLREEISRLMQP